MTHNPLTEPGAVPETAGVAIEIPTLNIFNRVIRNREMPYRVAPVLLILSLAAFFFVYYPTSQPIVLFDLSADIVKTAATFCVLGIGASLVIATAQIDLSSVGVATISGVIFALVLSEWSEGATIISVGVASAVALTVGLLSGRLVAWCFVRLRAPLLIFTWALGAVYVVVAILLTHLARAGSADVSGVPLPRLPLDFWHFGHGGFIGAVGAVILTLVVVHWVGLPQRAIAIGASEASAEYAGVNKKETYAQCFVANGVLAAVAGIFNATYLNQAATTDLSGKELIPIAVAVLGGTSLAGGYLRLSSVVAAGLFWAAMRLLGPLLPSLFPPLKPVAAEVGQILFFSVFIVVSLLFGRLLAPAVPKIFARKEP